MKTKIVTYNSGYLDKIKELDKKCFVNYWRYNDTTLGKLKKGENLNFVLFRNDTLVGFIFATKKQDGGNDFFLIERMGIHPNYRGEGLATKLVHEIINKSKLETIKLTVRKINTVAIELYKKLGFKTFKIDDNYYKRSDGEHRVAIKMEYKKN